MARMEKILIDQATSWKSEPKMNDRDGDGDNRHQNQNYDPPPCCPDVAVLTLKREIMEVLCGIEEADLRSKILKLSLDTAPEHVRFMDWLVFIILLWWLDVVDLDLVDVDVDLDVDVDSNDNSNNSSSNNNNNVGINENQEDYSDLAENNSDFYFFAVNEDGRITTLILGGRQIKEHNYEGNYDDDNDDDESDDSNDDDSDDDFDDADPWTLPLEISRLTMLTELTLINCRRMIVNLCQFPVLKELHFIRCSDLLNDVGTTIGGIDDDDDDERAIFLPQSDICSELVTLGVVDCKLEEPSSTFFEFFLEQLETLSRLVLCRLTKSTSAVVLKALSTATFVDACLIDRVDADDADDVPSSKHPFTLIMVRCQLGGEELAVILLQVLPRFPKMFYIDVGYNQIESVRAVVDRIRQRELQQQQNTRSSSSTTINAISTGTTDDNNDGNRNGDCNSCGDNVNDAGTVVPGGVAAAPAFVGAGVFKISESISHLDMSGNPIWKKTRQDPQEKAALLDLLATFRTIYRLEGRSLHTYDADIQYALLINHAGRRLLEDVDEEILERRSSSSSSNNSIVDMNGTSRNSNFVVNNRHPPFPLSMWPIVLFRSYRESGYIYAVLSARRKHKDPTGIYFLLRNGPALAGRPGFGGGTAAAESAAGSSTSSTNNINCNNDNDRVNTKNSDQDDSEADGNRRLEEKISSVSSKRQRL